MKTPAKNACLGLAIVAVAACGLVGNGAASPTFPQHEGFGPTGPAGATTGTIERRAGCLMYEAVGNIGPSLLIWPTDFASAEGGDGVVGGDRILLIGDEVALGGGEYTDEAWVFDRIVGPPVAPECRTGRYVLVTSIIDSPPH